jgi:5-methylcytosine-specific restriction endonuclease McrA
METTYKPSRKSKKLRKARRRAMQAQGGRCIYCRQPMWDDRPDAFCKAYGLPGRRALSFRCTAEHLVARGEGGPDSPENIAAACRFCNHQRHKAKKALDPVAYAAKVRSRLASGRWMRLTP